MTSTQILSSDSVSTDLYQEGIGERKVSGFGKYYYNNYYYYYYSNTRWEITLLKS